MCASPIDSDALEKGVHQRRLADAGRAAGEDHPARAPARAIERLLEALELARRARPPAPRERGEDAHRGGLRLAASGADTWTAKRYSRLGAAAGRVVRRGGRGASAAAG